ncbi:MAG: hypothetical protein QXM31_03365 [Candidatus Woesearchaeota archaeon]
MVQKVNVFTEWGKLEEVILGSCVNFNHIGIDKVFNFLYDNRQGDFEKKGDKHEILAQYISERQKDMDDLQKLIEGYGVTVKRVKSLDKISEIVTPVFKSFTTACDSPRDMYFAIGNEIIESPPTNRKRYFEHLLLRDIFMDYFRNGAKWTLAPRPSLDEKRLDMSFWKENLDKHVRGVEEIGDDYEIAFDAANCLKFGKDIVMNVGTKNHELGAVWLQRHLGDAFRVHPIRLCDSHIDGHIMPIAPGKLLVNEVVMYGHYHRLPTALQKWDRIPILDPATNFNYPSDHLQMASHVGMSVNVLSLDEKKILIRDNAKLTIDALYKAGFEPVPVQMRHCELFGGGIHCSTIDVRRKEQKEDYFK